MHLKARAEANRAKAAEDKAEADELKTAAQKAAEDSDEDDDLKIRRLAPRPEEAYWGVAFLLKNFLCFFFGGPRCVRQGLYLEAGPTACR